MRILIDMDGIVVNLLDEWLRFSNIEERKLNPDHVGVTRADVDRWDFHRFFPFMSKRVYGLLARPGFFDYLPAHPGAIEAITALHDAGHDVRFATSPPSADAARGKIEWVKREFRHLGFGLSRVLLLHEKSWLDCDMLIDDKPQTIEEWAEQRDTAKSQLSWAPAIATIWHPYNQDVTHRADFAALDCYSMEHAWDTMLDWIKDYAAANTVPR